MIRVMVVGSDTARDVASGGSPLRALDHVYRSCAFVNSEAERDEDTYEVAVGIEAEEAREGIVDQSDLRASTDPVMHRARQVLGQGGKLPRERLSLKSVIVQDKKVKFIFARGEKK